MCLEFRMSVKWKVNIQDEEGALKCVRSLECL